MPQRQRACPRVRTGHLSTFYVLIGLFVVHSWQTNALPLPLGMVAVPPAEVWQLCCTVSAQQCTVEPTLTSPPRQ